MQYGKRYMLHNFFSEKFTEHLQHVLVCAMQQARSHALKKRIDAAPEKNRHVQLTIEMLLNALAQEAGSIAYELLHKAGRERTDSPQHALQRRARERELAKR